MTFDDVLAQVVALLQRQGRVSYGALKRRFALDDAYLDDLKTELIDAQRLAVDEAGRILVWIGAADTPPVLSPSPLSPPPAPQADEISQGHVSPVIQPAAEAERRHLTVLFCDLADSTALASQLDPEDLRLVVRAYQQTCAEVIQHFDGHIAQYLGDGLLVYFGYPQAHEDDAHRAVRTGLDIVAAVGLLNARLTLERGVRLAVRLGIHTGPVVVGEVGGGRRREQLALGETPNIAARLQGLAAPDMVLISDTTYHLVQGYFTVAPQGQQPLRGVSTSLLVYQVIGPSMAQHRLEVVTAAGLTPLVGRQAEVTLLRERWAQSTQGAGQVVLLYGEAGIGKSRLVEVMREQATGAGATSLTFRCSAYHIHSALYPLLETMPQVLAWHRDDPAAVKLSKLEGALQVLRLNLSEVVPFLAGLWSLPVPASYPPLRLSPDAQKQQTLAVLVEWLLRTAERQPLLVVWEDLHWADPSTLELLALLIAQVPTTSLLLLLTCRPEFRAPWPLRAHFTQITLTRLQRKQVEAMLWGLTHGKALPAEVVDQMAAKTDGVPLFVEELTKTLLESELLQEVDDRYALRAPLSTLAIPTTLQDSLVARLDRLGPAKDVAHIGATLGREFAYEVLRAVMRLDETTLQDYLAQLVEAELLYQRGLLPQATYRFKNALIQDAAYQALLKRTRQQYHQRIAQVLEAQFPDIAAAQPELLAHHYTEADLTPQAIPYWQQAGQWALQRSAHAEAVGHLSKGLTLLLLQPDTPARMEQELGLQIMLGRALQAMKGYAAPEVEHTYNRAWTLSMQMEETPQLFPMFVGMQMFYVVRAELAKARQLAEQCLRLAERAQDPVLLIEAHTYLGLSLCFLGELVLAREHLGRAILRYGAQPHGPYTLAYGHDPGVLAGSVATWTLWLLGDIDQALQRGQETLTLARDLAHAHSVAFALWYMIVVYDACRAWGKAETLVKELMALAPTQGLQYWCALATYGRGWVGAGQGQYEAGIALMRQGITAYQNSGAKSAIAWMLCGLAEVYGKVGQVEEGLGVLAEMSEPVTPFHEAELWRVQGELRAQQGHASTPQAEACFSKALEVARHQQARSLELRAAMSLGRLWQRQGKRAEARHLLAEVYGGFTEGFDTADLQEARALLEVWV